MELYLLTLLHSHELYRTKQVKLNFFFSITTGPIEAKFYVESLWDEGTKACSNCLNHMTQMASMAIYGKIL